VIALLTLAAQITDNDLRPPGELSSSRCQSHPGESVRWVMTTDLAPVMLGFISW
jgi:hypothetical protein